MDKGSGEQHGQIELRVVRLGIVGPWDTWVLNRKVL